jgi:transglutaminase-like putative cysteine protease
MPPHQASAEWFLALVTAAVIVSFARVFDGGSFIGPLVVMAGALHLGLAIARRRGIGLLLVSGLSLVGFALVATWLLFGSTTRALLPTAHTVTTARAALQSSWHAFQQVVAPTTPRPGFMLVAAFAICFAVFLADWAAFRLWAPLEALVPTATLFGFTAFVGSTRLQIFATALYAAMALLFVLEHRVAQRERTTTWLANDVERGSSWLVHMGAIATAIAIAAGALVGPRLPGAGQPGLVHWHGNHGGSNARVTISPLVDIQSKLNKQTDTTLFIVNSPRPAYWRLTSLDTFDGTIWKSSGRYDTAGGSLSGTLPKGIPDPGKGAELTQTFSITQLSELWLPAAYVPVHIDAAGFRVRYQGSSSTLIVDTNLPSSDSQSYTVRSVVPAYRPDDLRRASTDIPSSIRADLAVPGLSANARAIAREVTKDATTPYDKALALQNYFRDPRLFTYDPDVRFFNDDNAIDTFLRVRRGFCQQFAGTFAALARAVGLPTRIAVGFTQGESDPTNPTRYEVKGGQAHAWPEVYLGQFGWVPFEPTPGRGAPGEQAYLGVPPAQDNDPGAATTTTLPSSTSTLSPTTVPLPKTRPNENVNTTPTPSSSGRSSGVDVAAWLGAIAVVLLGASLLYAAIVPALYSLARRRRRARAQDPSARVRVAWLESEEALALVGAARRPDETAREFADRASTRLPTQTGELHELADAADAAVFGVGDVDEQAAEAAEASTTSVCTVVSRHVPRWRRALLHLDARRVRVDQPH